MKTGIDLTGAVRNATDPNISCGRLCMLFDAEGTALIKVSGYLREDGAQVDAYLRRDAEGEGERGAIVNRKKQKQREQYTIDILCEYLRELGYTILASVRGEDKTDTLCYPNSEFLMDIKALTPDGSPIFIEVDGSNDISKEKYEFILGVYEASIYRVDVNSDVIQQYLEAVKPTFKELQTWYAKVVEPHRQVKLTTIIDGLTAKITERGDGRYRIYVSGPNTYAVATAFEYRGETKIRVNQMDGIQCEQFLHIGWGPLADYLEAGANKLKEIVRDRQARISNNCIQ